MEALACGLPVITTKSGGPEELINSSNGIIVEHNKREIYEAMKLLVMNYNSYNSFDIRKDCLEHFGSDKVLNELLNVYQNVLNSNN
jgi:glycosyltransferase involved in cell wall biosynthesis